VTEFDALRADDAELAELRSAIRGFLVADRAQHHWQPAVDCWLSKWDADFSIRLADAGFVGLTIPKEYGGHGLGHLHRYVVTEELLAHGAPVGAHWIADRQVAPGLMSFGSEEQRRRLLPRIAEGRLYSAIGMSEHGAGSDLAAVATRATRSADGWVLNGSKVWTSGAHLAHQVVVLARTSPLNAAHRHAGFSQFIVPTDAPGVTISPILLMDGEHHFNEVVFDDVALTDDDVLGELGAGWHQVTAELGFERSGPERILSTATMLFEIFRALGAQGDTASAAAVGELVARISSLRQLSISVARALADGEDAATRAALVKDLGTRFEQESVELAADLLDHVEPTSSEALRLRGLLAVARVHSPLFTLRGGTNEVLRGVVAKSLERAPAASRPADELSQLVDDVGRQSFEAGLGRRGLPNAFDEQLWRTLEDTGLSRLTSAEGAGIRESAVVLSGLARWAAAVPVAETDVLAAWLATEAGLAVPATGPLTVALADAKSGERITGTATDVPWPRAGAVLLAARTADALSVVWLSGPVVTDSHNLAGEPRGAIAFDVSADDVVRLAPEIGDELVRRGAWARCVQLVGAFEAATELTVAHTRDRVQFGRPLSQFQAVAHALAAMAGELERARAAVTLATAAAADYGFGSPQSDQATTVAKVAVGRAVAPVCTIAHQLHGAIGVTIEHPLWLATMRARSWADEFGTTGFHARRLGRMALVSDDPWDLVVGR
jgi:alkylation response protein AidB-like acyl-CoA dehydrogenase